MTEPEFNPSAPEQGAETAPPDYPGAALEARAAAVLGEAAADAAPPRRGRGRPRGSRTRNRTARPAPATEPAAEPAPIPEPTEAELKALAFMLGTAWRLAGARLRRRPLTDDEAAMLASAAHPVLAKYGGGVLDKWAPEIGLGMTLLALWTSTEVPADDSGEVFELGPTAEVTPA